VAPGRPGAAPPSKKITGRVDLHPGAIGVLLATYERSGRPTYGSFALDA
jgi:hypothetical protein